jgi:hypothetical protein
MARVLAMHEVDSTLSRELSSSLRVVDDVIILPQGHHSLESGLYKNVAMKLDGTEANLNYSIFSPCMFTGVSAIAIPSAHVDEHLATPEQRKTTLQKLASMIPSDVTSTDVQVGPLLDGDERDCDTEPWVAGFDGPSSCIGLYSARESRPPANTHNANGMHRMHNTYYLVCKAGGGVATQAFHSRLTASLQKGLSLDECLLEGNAPGPSGLRRALTASERNRSRLLTLAAKVLGFYDVDTIGDTAACPSDPNQRFAVTLLNVNVNTLRKLDDVHDTQSKWQYASGCVDTALSTGLISCSNATDGFVAFIDANGNFQTSIRNQALNCIPFLSERLLSNKQVVCNATERHKETRSGKSGVANAHPDHDWIRTRFIWTDSGSKDGTQVWLEPPCLWGTFDKENFVTTWGRELGISALQSVHMTPEMVVVAGVEHSKLKAASQALAS